MSFDEIPVELLSKFVKDIVDFTGEKSEGSFIEAIRSSIQETLRNEFACTIEDQVTPLIRNIEIQHACQISKTNEIYADLKKTTDELAAQIAKTNEHINFLKVNLALHLEKIEGVNKVINRKAELFELQALAKEVSQMTPLKTFFTHQEWSQTLATKVEITRVDLDIAKARELISECPTITQMLNEQAKIVVDFRSELSKEKASLICKINDFREVINKTNGKIDNNKAKMKQNIEILSRNIKEVMENILSKPWTPDVDMLKSILVKKADACDLIDLKKSVEPKLQEFISKFEQLSDQVVDYSEVMARFDEVILTKSSKEDVKIIKNLLSNFVAQQKLDPILSEIASNFSKTEEKLKSFNTSLEEITKEVSSYAVISAFQKSQARDHAKLLDSMKTLNENLKIKADKSDIYSMFDIMGYREDIINLSSIIEKTRELFSQAVVLQHEAISTFLLSADPPVTKNRRRAEIKKNLEFLMQKLTVSKEGDDSPKRKPSKKWLSSVASIRTESFTDEKLIVSRTSSTRNRRVASAANKKHSLAA